MSLDILSVYNFFNNVIFIANFKTIYNFWKSLRLNHSFYINIFPDSTSAISVPKAKVKCIIRFRIRYVFVPYTLKLKLLYKLDQCLKYINIWFMTYKMKSNLQRD